MNIREIRREDIGTVINIINRNYNDIMIKVHSKDVLERFKEHNTVGNWESQMNWKQIFVVEECGEIVATGALANFGDNTSPKYCISNFFVQPESHGNGIGRLLFEYILQVVKGKGINLLHVPSSRTGFEFYNKMGFFRDHIQEDEADEIIWMTKSI
ncbi:MAG: GNAT family N-acetyltransferase [Bacillota bacterium]|nr:GNAT family N-acetyltransferase [Bacillota bacterium]